MPHKELIFWVASADIGIIPYLGNNLNNYYSLPNKLFELIIAGVPIVANDLPELKKVILKEKIGLICDAQNPNQLLRRLINYLRIQINIKKLKIT